MTRTHYRFLENDPSPYFITATTVNWLPLFSNPEIANILIQSLHYLTAAGRIQLYAYVIMENHLHLVADAKDLSKEIANFKSFTARVSIDYYEAHQNNFMLNQLTLQLPPDRSDRTYHFWQNGSHPQRIKDEAMLRQKVEYIHCNPVKRGYVDLPEHWRYSSARNYVGMKGLLPICVLED